MHKRAVLLAVRVYVWLSIPCTQYWPVRPVFVFPSHAWMHDGLVVPCMVHAGPPSHAVWLRPSTWSACMWCVSFPDLGRMPCVLWTVLHGLAVGARLRLQSLQWRACMCHGVFRVRGSPMQCFGYVGVP